MGRNRLIFCGAFIFMIIAAGCATHSPKPPAPLYERLGGKEAISTVVNDFIDKVGQDASVDVVTSNGVLNLVPDKPRALSEIFRVLRPGGRIQIADIVLGRSIKAESRNNPRLWAECIVGAVMEEEYLEMFRKAGFREAAAIHHLDYFSKSPEAETREVAASYGAKAIVLKG